ncbi:protein transport protein SEC31-like [Penaeus chinensis]|uniref:protein transport protein SEC31-like n=1 Tax=Penaeus chinensis TaxID=139456 RepID=UPI001FB69858|nr:protein transport protein SEC31-like [Penaeus chinensis]
MAPQHGTGLAVRSMVRIPGSGWDRSAGAVCCDFSKVSTLAASAVTPQPLPLLHQRLSSRPSLAASNMDKLTAGEAQKVCEEVARGSRKRALEDTRLTSESSSSKVVRASSVTPSGVARAANPPRVQERTATPSATQVIMIRPVQQVPYLNKQMQSVPTLQGTLHGRPVTLIPVTHLAGVPLSSAVLGRPSSSPSPSPSPSNAASRPTVPISARRPAVGNSAEEIQPVHSGVILQTATTESLQRVSVAESSIRTLLEESQQLRRQNAVLNQRLSHYQEIFSDGQRLRREMSTLGIQVY